MLALTYSAVPRTQACVGKLSHPELGFNRQEWLPEPLCASLDFLARMRLSCYCACVSAHATGPASPAGTTDVRREAGCACAIAASATCAGPVPESAGLSEFSLVGPRRSVDPRAETEKSVGESSAPGCRSQR